MTNMPTPIYWVIFSFKIKAQILHAHWYLSELEDISNGLIRRGDNFASLSDTKNWWIINKYKKCQLSSIHTSTDSRITYFQHCTSMVLNSWQPDWDYYYYCQLLSVERYVNYTFMIIPSFWVIITLANLHPTVHLPVFTFGQLVLMYNKWKCNKHIQVYHM